MAILGSKRAQPPLSRAIELRGMNLRRRLVALKSARRNGRDVLRVNRSSMSPEF